MGQDNNQQNHSSGIYGFLMRLGIAKSKRQATIIMVMSSIALFSYVILSLPSIFHQQPTYSEYMKEKWQETHQQDQ